MSTYYDAVAEKWVATDDVLQRSASLNLWPDTSTCKPKDILPSATFDTERKRLDFRLG